MDVKVNKLKFNMQAVYKNISKSKENLANNNTLNVQEVPQRSKESPRRDCPLLVLVKHCCPRLKGTDHLFDHVIKKQAGQMTVQEGFELKGNIEVHFAGGLQVTGTSRKSPYRLQLTEQGSVGAHSPDFVVGDNGDL